MFFFFQAEDGIRDIGVTGVQTCALPISGFRNSVAAYTVSLLNPKVIRDLDLHGHGLEIVERRALNFLPTLHGDYLLAGEGRTKAEIAKFSARDAERYDAFSREIETIADVLRDVVLEAPPNVTEGFGAR